MVADLVFFAIVILGGVVGTLVGASRGLLKSIKWIVIFVIIFLCANQVANLIAGTTSGEKFSNFIYEKLYKNTQLEQAVYMGNNKVSIEGEIISIEEIAARFRIPTTYIGSLSKHLVEGQKISVTLGQITAINLIKIIFIIVVPIIVGIVFSITSLLLKKNKKEGQSITVKDRIFGGSLGLIMGIFLAFFVVIIIYMMRELSALETLITYLDNETRVISKLIETPLFKRILRV